jgi:hypothetical protein
MPSWKNNWPESRQRFTDWWDRRGVLKGKWTPQELQGKPHQHISRPPEPASGETIHSLPELRAEWNHYTLSRSDFSEDTLPIADTDIGPGSLCLYLGCEPGFSPETVWFKPCWQDLDSLDEAPPIRLDSSNPWWQATLKTLRACRERAGGRYFTGCPDLVENVDILAAMREPQVLMTDMLDDPETVSARLREITDAWMQVYQEIYDIVREPDGSATFGAFRLWAPGKVAKIQCDSSAMFSPAMFREFAAPELKRQCEWLDYSLYHLDGTQAVCHLDALLEIEALDAIEWTPQAGIEDGTDPRWFPMYRKILESGKSLQVIAPHPEGIKPLLNAIGSEGIYIIEP